ncbi:MAG: hypothetical protein ACXWQZ_18395, partial [Ktedonobacterales bacterium]
MHGQLLHNSGGTNEKSAKEGIYVLSIHQSDMIVYAANLRDYLVRELLIEGELSFRLDEMDEFEGTYEDRMSKRYKRYHVM